MDAPSHPARVTLKDVAKAAGVSPSTVSLVMHEDPRIPEETRLRVKAAAERMGYSANASATLLARFRRGSNVRPVQDALAWINAWPDPKQLRSYRHFDLYWHGATRAAQKFGYRLEEFVVNQTLPPRRIQEILQARNVRGIVIPPHPRASDSTSTLDRFNWSNFDWSRFSVVRLGHNIDLPVHSITSDQFSNGMMAFDKMRERGYERVGFVGWSGRTRRFGAGFVWAQNQLPEP